MKHFHIVYPSIFKMKNNIVYLKLLEARKMSLIDSVVVKTMCKMYGFLNSLK